MLPRVQNASMCKLVRSVQKSIESDDVGPLTLSLYKGKSGVHVLCSHLNSIYPTHLGFFKQTPSTTIIPPSSLETSLNGINEVQLLGGQHKFEKVHHLNNVLHCCIFIIR
jgi:hypothetical protein